MRGREGGAGTAATALRAQSPAGPLSCQRGHRCQRALRRTGHVPEGSAATPAGATLASRIATLQPLADRLPSREAPTAVSTAQATKAPPWRTFSYLALRTRSRNLADGLVPQGSQLVVAFGGGSADLGGGDLEAAELLHDLRGLSGSDAMDVHLSDNRGHRLFPLPPA